MPESNLLEQIARKDLDKAEIAERVIHQPELLDEVFAGLQAEKADVKYGAEKVLRLVSEKKPAILYPRLDFFVSNLDSENTFFRWGAMRIIANLAAVDSANKIDAVLDRYFEPIPGPVLIAAANVIEGAARIARAKPYLADRVAGELLKVERAQYQNEACRHIALGKVIESFGKFFDLIQNRRQQALQLVKGQLESPRPATRKKAEKFLAKHN